MSELSPDLQTKYPTAKHAPLPDCSRCHGTGERWYESTSPYSRSGWKPCMCLFVEHQLLPLVSEMFQEMIAKEKAALMQLKAPMEIARDGEHRF